MSFSYLNTYYDQSSNYMVHIVNMCVWCENDIILFNELKKLKTHDQTNTEMLKS
jgi:hypothetical protein